MSDYFLNKIYDSLLSNKPVPKKPEPIVEKKETFKPLSKVYYRILAERIEEAKDHIAVYGSQDLVDPKDIPQKPGLDVLGVASRVDTERLRQRLKVETETFKTSVKTLLQKKGLPVKQLLNQLIERIINTDLKYADEFFNTILNNNGLFEIPQTGTFNCIEPAINGFVSRFEQGKADGEKIHAFLLNMLQYPLKMDSSMNIGPGEIYLCLFANAQMSVGETGSKSGDVVADGAAIEVKATTFKAQEDDEGKSRTRLGKGARLGGADNTASKGLISVPEYINNVNKGQQADLKATKKADKKLVDDIIKEIESTKIKLNSSQETEQLFNIFYNNLKTISHRNRMADHNILNRVFKPFATVWSQPNIPKNLLLQVKGKGRGQELFRVDTKGKPFLDVYKDFINSAIKEELPSFKEVQQVKPIKKDTARLDELLSWALDTIKDNPEVTFDNIIDKIILPLNSYPQTAFNISAELKSALQSRENVISKFTTLTEAGELIGAIHLYTYKLVTKFEKLLIVNTQKGDSIVFNAPNNIQEALTITQTPGIFVNAGIDRLGGKTMGRAQSVNIQYKP